MKWGFESTSCLGPPKSGTGDSCALDDENFRNARREAEHYSVRISQTLEEREARPIVHLRKLNDWAVKSGSEHIIPRGVGFGVRVEEDRPAKFN
ncbi:mRNA cap guanine-N7 methyltransferase 1-like [Zingiber officinale]|uniref:mRNA cap guanine-N7 methyltransferase 1-like n=1 Tax=Zingiber officinale TaxID=94328 RepID=UPI001C4A9C8B|nr:mRNA cap guanine-N7 methyltransferase 1-like [Zingiber officinale]